MFGFEFVPMDLRNDKDTLYAMLDGSQRYLGVESVDFVLIPSNPRGRIRVDSLLGAYALKCSGEFDGVEFIPTISSSSGNLAQIKSQILAVGYAGFRSVALIGGDSENLGIGGVELIALAREMLGESVCLISGIGSVFDDANRLRLEDKIKAGVDRIITQPIFDRGYAEKFLNECEGLKVKYGRGVEVFLGILGILNAKNARQINEAHLGFEIPRDYIESMRDEGASRENFRHLWKAMGELVDSYHASLYLCTSKANDLRHYGSDEV